MFTLNIAIISRLTENSITKRSFTMEITNFLVAKN